MRRRVKIVNGNIPRVPSRRQEVILFVSRNFGKLWKTLILSRSVDCIVFILVNGNFFVDFVQKNIHGDFRRWKWSFSEASAVFSQRRPTLTVPRSPSSTSPKNYIRTIRRPAWPSRNLDLVTRDDSQADFFQRGAFSLGGQSYEEHASKQGARVFACVWAQLKTVMASSSAPLPKSSAQ